jgi:hypothetical protein
MNLPIVYKILGDPNSPRQEPKWRKRCRVQPLLYVRTTERLREHMTGNSPAIPRFPACASFTQSRALVKPSLLSTACLRSATGARTELTWALYTMALMDLYDGCASSAIG